MRGWAVGVVVVAWLGAAPGGAAQEAEVPPGDAPEAAPVEPAAPGDEGTPEEEPAQDEGTPEPAVPPPPALTPPPPPPPPGAAAPLPPPPPEAPRYPVAFAQRPLTVPGGMARVDATFFITSEDRELLDRQAYVSFLGIVGFGVAEGIELGVVALPIQIAPEGLFHEPGVYALLRFLDTGDVELGAQVEARVPIREASAFATALSLRGLWHVSGRARLDVAAAYLASFQDPDTVSELRFPVAFTFQTSETFYLGVQSGLDVADFDDAYIPASAYLGGTLRSRRGPALDLRASLYLASVTDGFALWTVGLGATFFVY